MTRDLPGYIIAIGLLAFLGFFTVSTIISGNYDLSILATVSGVVVALLVLWANNQAIYRQNELKKQEIELNKQVMMDTFDRLVKSERKGDDALHEIGRYVARGLQEDPSWLSNALESAVTYPYHNTTFQKRSDHFREEKLAIAAFTAKYLFHLLKEQLNKKNKPKVYVFIDSGSTLSPMFASLGEAIQGCEGDFRDLYSRNVRILTNNLAGIDEFMTVNGDYEERYFKEKKTSLTKISLLPGRPRSAYRAVTSDTKESGENRTKDYFDSIVKEARKNNDKVHVISIVNGNWFSYSTSLGEKASVPIPLCQGVGHAAIKGAAVTAADELILPTPLPKLIPLEHGETVENTINKELFQGTHNYQEVEGEYKFDKVTLITAGRQKTSALQPHAIAVRTAFNLRELGYDFQSNEMGANPFANRDREQTLGFMLPFETNLNTSHGEKRSEFPHPYTWNEKMFRKFSAPQLHYGPY